MKTSYRKLKRDINKYNKLVNSAKKLKNKMMQGGLMDYMEGGHMNPAAAMFGSNSEKISNMSSPLFGVNTARTQIGYPKAAEGMNMNTYGMGGYYPVKGQMGMNVQNYTNDAGMQYSLPTMYQQGGRMGDKFGSMKQNPQTAEAIASNFQYAPIAEGEPKTWFNYTTEDGVPVKMRTRDISSFANKKRMQEGGYSLPPVTYGIDSQGYPTEAYTLPTATVTAKKLPKMFMSEVSDFTTELLDAEEENPSLAKIHDKKYGRSWRPGYGGKKYRPLSEMSDAFIKDAEDYYERYRESYNKYLGENFKEKFRYQEGGQAPMPNSQDMAMAMAQQEGAPMPPMQQEQPMQQDQAMQEEQMMQQLVQLAQAAMAGDEQAIQMIEQLPEEQQQMILQIMQELEAQGGQGQMEAPMEGQPMMMYGGIMNATKKSKTTKSKKKNSNNKMMDGGYTKKYSTRKSSMKKMNSLYNTLGIPC